ncbi:DUF4148 domain-containing protein [Herminiimonas sp. CN]|uniref:DUF4148 domain-containing protein n=1 Tax=Herminiimonas sp. CN TaxID=1349818 RepID=UPI000473CC9F|nr:DUF4148 domain-containing protein [Herminiimonas sp. CN]
MKTRSFIAAVFALSAIVTASSAFADRPYPPDEPVAGSTKSRAEVRAELEQARKDGTLMNSGEHGFHDEWIRPGIGAGAQGVAGSRYSGRTREEVKAETMEYMKNHTSSFDEMYSR